MDTVFDGIIVIYVLSFLAIALMVYNRIKWKDELHGFFKLRRKPEEEDA